MKTKAILFGFLFALPTLAFADCAYKGKIEFDLASPQGSSVVTTFKDGSVYHRYECDDGKVKVARQIGTNKAKWVRLKSETNSRLKTITFHSWLHNKKCPLALRYYPESGFDRGFSHKDNYCYQ